MKQFSHASLQHAIDALDKSIASLLGLSGDEVGYGIVSLAIESKQPVNLAVSWSEDLQRLSISSGTAVFKNGGAATLDNSINDLPWPDLAKLYVVLAINQVDSTVLNKFKRSVVLEGYPESYVALFTPDEYEVLDQNKVVLIGVLTRSSNQSDIDATAIYTAENRPTATVLDVDHRYKRGKNFNHSNAHGLEIDDLNVNGLTLLTQLFTSGYMVPVESDFAIPGRREAIKIDHAISIDSIGRLVEPGHYYFVLPGIPVAKPLAQSTETGYEIEIAWTQSKPIIDFGLTHPGEVIITWVRVKDLEISTRSFYSSTLEFKSIVDGPVVSDGMIVEAESTDIDLGKFDGVSINMSVEIDKNGVLQSAPRLIDTAVIASKKNMESSAVELEEYSQLSVAVVNSPNKKVFRNPDGSIDVLSTDFIGTRRLTYTVIGAPISEMLVLMPTPWSGSHIASVTGWHGRVMRDGQALNDRYWRRHGNNIYIEDRAIRPGSVFTYEANEFETNRFKRGFKEAVGTKLPPTGIAATASIELLSNSLSAGDIIYVRFDANSNPVQIEAGVDYAVGMNTSVTASNIVAKLNSNTLFYRRAVASSSGSLIVITARVLGTNGNNYSLSAYSTGSSNKFDVVDFDGGGSYKENKYDLVGLDFNLYQPQGVLPPGSKIRVYVTNVINDEKAALIYYKLIDLDVAGNPKHRIAVTPALVDSIDESVTYDLNKTFYAKIQIAGTDVNGSQATEIIELDDLNCFEPEDPMIEYSEFKSTGKAWRNITRWTLLDSKNEADTKVVFTANALNRGGSSCKLADIDHRGSVRSVSDNRLLKPSTLTSIPQDQRSALIGGLALKAFK